MSPRHVPRSADPIAPPEGRAVRITLEDREYAGVEGQTIAGVLLCADRLDWRVTSSGDAPRGVFCGIGICFDCVAEVNGERDVRLCQRRAREGDSIRIQRDPLAADDLREVPE